MSHPYLYYPPMMHRKLLSLMISLLLALSPFASLDVAAAISGEGHCMMMETASSDSVGAGYAHSDEKTGHNCPHCQDDGCNDNGCASHGCSAGSLSLINNEALAADAYTSLQQSEQPNTNLLSHTSPPLLRPPV